MQAVLLAAGRLNGTYKALKTFGGKTMLEIVAEALFAGGISRIVAAGDVRAMASYRTERLQIVNGGDCVVQSLLEGVRHLRGHGMFLAATADTPFLTAASVRAFLSACQDKETEVYYPIVSRQAMERRFGGARRTYIQLKEGEFTGGSLMLLSPAALERCLPLARRLTDARKSPWRMARILGWKILWHFLLRDLTAQLVSERLLELSGVKAKAVVSPYAELGMDIDKAEDEKLARKEKGEC